MSVNILCIGGPRDGERIAISDRLYQSGRFEVIDFKGGLAEYDGYKTTWYQIEQIQMREGVPPVATVAVHENNATWLMQLIDGYHPRHNRLEALLKQAHTYVQDKVGCDLCVCGQRPDSQIHQITTHYQ